MRLLALIVLVACATAPQQRVTPPPPGALGEIQAMNDLDGTVLGPSSARATIVVLLASWCQHCKAELSVLDSLRPTHPYMRVLGLNFKGHEEYDHRGSPLKIRAYATEHPWLRIAPIDEPIYRMLGSPPMVPTMFVFDEQGRLVEEYDRRIGAMPGAEELSLMLAKLGA